MKDGDAWGIMSAYNRLGGEFCAHNRRLLTDILRDEWGFDGFVVSDWYGVHDATGAANAGLNLEMPGPVRIYGNKLAAAVERGEVTEAQVDRLVRDLLVLANRTKADERSADEPEQSVDDPAERALTRRAAIAGTVLLRNDAASTDRRSCPSTPPRSARSRSSGPMRRSTDAWAAVPPASPRSVTARCSPRSPIVSAPAPRPTQPSPTSPACASID